MRLSLKSWALVAFAAVMGLFAAWEPPAPALDELPSLPAFKVEEITRITLSTPVEKLELRRVGAGEAPAGGAAEDAAWEMITPLQVGADAAQVRSLLRTFAEGLPMEAYVDEGHLEDYAVDHQYGKLVEIFGAGAEPLVSVTVGKTAAGGTTFVRIRGSDKVYRADVGGRARYDRPAAAWRDRVVLDVDRAEIQAVRVSSATGKLQFTRGPSAAQSPEGTPIPGPWTTGDLPFAIDSETVEALVRTVAQLRAQEIHHAEFPGGFDPPAAVVELTLADGAQRRLVLGTAAAEGAAFVRVDGRAEVFRVNGQLRRQVALDAPGLRSRQLLKFDRADVESVALVEGGLTVVLSAEGDGTTWSITQPANMATDSRQALFTVNTLANLRAHDVAPDDGFQPSGARLEVRFRDGRAQVLEIGQVDREEAGQPTLRVRVAGQPGVFRLRTATLAELKKAFGRG